MQVNYHTGDQVGSGSMFDAVLFLFIPSIQGTLAVREKANKKNTFDNHQQRTVH